MIAPLKKRNILIILVVILILFVYIKGYIKIPSGGLLNDVSYSSVSMKDLNQNPTNYIGKEIQVRGYLRIAGLGYYLEDSEGYTLWIEDNCREEGRSYDISYYAGKPDTTKYSAKGLFLAPTSKSSGFGFDLNINQEYRIRCSSPLV